MEEEFPYSKRRSGDEPRWEDAHQRGTFYGPRVLVKAIAEDMAQTRRSKSQVIVDAITLHLRRHK